MAGRIAAMQRATAAQLCSGQVVTQLSTAVKELVENSLDAGSTTVEVRLFNYGADKIEVEDNGSGVDPENFEALVAKHFTSKISKFEDIWGVKSFGFRGEALSSLCELSETFTVTTRTASDEMGTQLEYARDGKLLDRKPCARQVGTTVTVCNLFTPLPVRRREFTRTIKRQYTKALLALQGYAVVATGVRLSCVHIPSSGRRQVAITTRGNATLRENLSNVFGPQFVREVQEVDFDLDDTPPAAAEEEGREEEAEEEDGGRGEGGRKVKGVVSRAGAGVGRSNNDRQFTFVNGRPVDHPRVVRVVNDTWRQFEMKHKPAFILDFHLPSGSFDVNVAPDKREVILTEEDSLLSALKAKLEALWEPSRRTFQVGQGGIGLSANPQATLPFSPSARPPGTKPTEERREDRRRGGGGGGGEAGMQDDGDDGEGGDEAVLDLSQLSRSASLASSAGGSQPSRSRSRRREPLKALPPSMTASSAAASSAGESRRKKEEVGRGEGEEEEQMDDEVIDLEAFEKDTVGDEEDRREEEEEGEEGGGREATELPPSAPSLPSHQPSPSPPSASSRSQRSTESTSGRKRRRTSAPEPVQREPCVWEELEAQFRRATARAGASSGAEEEGGGGGGGGGVGEAAGIHDGEDEATKAAAERELTRSLSQASFERMRVVGQFNYGFIIAQLGPDLFIVDQHASDEKARYEHLIATTTFHEQRLIAPRPLDLTAAEEHVIIDHLDVFRKNGFHFEVEEDAPPGQRVKLAAIPYSKGTTFGEDDIHELASLLGDAPSATEIRLPKARAMFASRACRSAIMIGHPLSRSRMRQVIKSLAELKQPWNCPHGRPTLRHLVDLRQVERHGATREQGEEEVEEEEDG